jgi:AraC-like DNA-binding protein
MQDRRLYADGTPTHHSALALNDTTRDMLPYRVCSRSNPIGKSPEQARWLKAEGMALGVCDLTGGSSLEVHAKERAAYLVCLSLEGLVGIRGKAIISLVPEGQIDLQPVSGAITLSSKSGASAVLLVISAESLHQRLRWRRGTPQALAASAPRLANGSDSLATRVLTDCLVHAGRHVVLGATRQQASRLCDLLLTLLEEAIETPAPAGQGVAGPWYVTLVERYIAECAAGAVSLKDLAGLAGISPRTLHEGFRKYRGYSPMRYLRQRRIQAVRNELTNPREMTTVTDAAMHWGFNHLGRFSAYYAEQFGESPSETLRAARLRSPAPGVTALAAHAG